MIFTFVETDFDLEGLEQAWFAVSAGGWRDNETLATGHFNFRPEVGKIVVTSDDRASNRELTALRVIDTKLIDIRYGSRIERMTDNHNDVAPR